MDTRDLDPNELEQWERIDGVVYDMSPSPSTEHQRIVRRLTLKIGSYLEGKSCELFTSPFDVYLDDVESGQYVQPDLLVVCDSSKIHENGCYGAPDMVVEVMSPRTIKKDKTVKLRAYKTSGVREYWIVDPVNQFVEVYDFQGDVPFPKVYEANESVTVKFLEDLEIALSDIFGKTD